ncbi:MAG: tRNA-dihydrouridine synthase family protein [Desulfobacteraceae bacterium]|nr:tRNA-dihydrouridine synthase family protein [Desulfobacteraceae bacterium]
MVGLSHSALRSLILELGGAGIFFTEMLSAKRIPNENQKVSPFLIRSPEEYPLFYQLFLVDDINIELVVDKLTAFGAQGIDINLGCPAPKLKKIGAGCYLAKRPNIVKKIISKVRKHTDLPLSVKIRLGETLDESSLYQFCDMLESEGIDFLTMHGRLYGEKFCRRPRWDWIGKVKKRLEIPVFANGGIFSIEDAKRCLELSGADGLMVGRGAVINPWLLAEIANNVYGLNIKKNIMQREGIYMRFVELLNMRFREERRLGRLKQFTHYFAGTYKFGHHLASEVQGSSTMFEAEKRAQDFFARSA